MRRHARLVAMVLTGALGMASALALSAGASDVKACISKSGVVSAIGPTARCAAGRSVITISGDAFKQGRRGTITINGVPFRKGSRGQTITINGTSFRAGRGQTLTINGTAFRTGTLPNTLTINGNSFRSGTLPNTITINGNSFRSGTLPNTITINGVALESRSPDTITINGTPFGAGAAAAQGPAGPQGPEGEPGAAGAPGTVAPGRAPVELDGPVSATSGSSAKLVALEFTSGEPRRIQLAGGFNAVCNPCTTTLTPGWDLRMDGASKSLTQRRLAPVGDGEHAGASISEILVTPAVCGPCTFTLSLVVPPDAGGQTQTVAASAIRLGLVDLGPVVP